MSIYVDAIVDYPPDMVRGRAKRCGTRWCHLWCDEGEEESLHKFAASIGMRREWFQHEGKRYPHYDLVPVRRALALAAGAEELSFRVWLIRRKRVEKGAASEVKGVPRRLRVVRSRA